MPRSAAALRRAGRIRVGLIGEEQPALRDHIDALNASSEYDLIAVSAQGELSALSASDRDIATAAVSSSELFAHPEVDLVAIGGMSASAHGWIRDAISAGKDIYCEWPIAPDSTIASELASSAKQAGIDHFVGLHPRISRGNLYIADLVTQGYIGRIRSVRLFARTGKGPEELPNEHFLSREHVQSLPVLALCVLDGLLPVVGRLQSLSCLMSPATKFSSGLTIPKEKGQLAMVGRTDDDVILTAHFEEALDTPEIQIEIRGESGRLRSTSRAGGASDAVTVEGAHRLDLPMMALPIPRLYNWSSPSQFPSTGSKLINLYAGFVRDLHERTSLVATLDDGARLHHLLDVILHSALAARGIDLG